MAAEPLDALDLLAPLPGDFIDAACDFSQLFAHLRLCARCRRLVAKQVFVKRDGRCRACIARGPCTLCGLAPIRIAKLDACTRCAHRVYHLRKHCTSAEELEAWTPDAIRAILARAPAYKRLYKCNAKRPFVPGNVMLA